MTPSQQTRTPLELWVRAAFGLGLAALAVFVLLGFESPALWHRRLYQLGPVLLGLCGAVVLAAGLALSVRRRPFMQRGRMIAFLLAGVCLLIGGCPMPYPSPYEARISGLTFAFPLEGEWRVRFGGEEPFWNPLVLQPDRRFGFEFWRTDEAGQPDRDGTVGNTVLAPAPGKLVGIHSLGEAGSGTGALDRAARAQIVLALEDGTFLILSGLDRSTLQVAEGDLVQAGAPLGSIGLPAEDRVPASLGMHLQDTPEPGNGAGMPLCFDRLTVEGELRERVVPAGGMRQGQGAGGWKVSAGGSDSAP